MHFAGFVELIAINTAIYIISSQGIKHDSREFLLIDNLHRRGEIQKRPLHCIINYISLAFT